MARVKEEWGRVLSAIRQRSPQVGAYLEGSAPHALEGSDLRILLPAGQTFARDKLEGGLDRVAAEALNEHLDSALRVSFLVAGESEGAPAQSPKRKVYEDRDVRKILDTFEGSVMSVENEDQP